MKTNDGGALDDEQIGSFVRKACRTPLLSESHLNSK